MPKAKTKSRKDKWLGHFRLIHAGFPKRVFNMVLFTNLNKSSQRTYPIITPTPRRNWFLLWFINPLNASVKGRGLNFFSKTAPTDQFESMWPSRKEKKHIIDTGTGISWHLPLKTTSLLGRSTWYPIEATASCIRGFASNSTPICNCLLARW